MSNSKLALKGSSRIVSDYFEFSINSILFQRGIYPQEDFSTVRKYDLPMLMNNDEDVKAYIQTIMKQIKKWIYGKKLLTLVLVIVSKSNYENIERWEFNLDIIGEEGDNTEKPFQEIQKEIRAIIRQITSSVSYLPKLDEDEEYTFNVLVYTDPNTTVPIEWCDTQGDGKLIEGGQIENVKFASFSTDLHQVGTAVTYKLE